MIAPLVLGFCLIFAGSLLSRSFWLIEEQTRAGTFMEGILQLVGGLVLCTASAVGAFVVEDKYATLGLLLFSALVTVYVLTTTAPIYSP